MSRFAALTTALAAVSCDASALTVDVDMGPDLGSHVVAAIRSWDAVTSRGVVVAPDGDWIVVSGYAPLGGFTQRRRHLIRISPDTPEQSIFPVAMHELGHALGLEHTCSSPIAVGKVSLDRPCNPTSSFGVMDPIHQTSELSDDDIFECVRAGACR